MDARFFSYNILLDRFRIAYMMEHMAEISPKSGESGITNNDLRAFVLDQSVENNLLDLDLTWSDSEILEAKRRCAMHYNSIDPAVDSLRVDPFRMPNEYPFLVGTAYQMYLSKLQQYQRNDLDYTIGGVQSNLFSKRIEHFTKMLSFLREEFEVKANTLKVSQNLNNAWTVFC